MPPGDGEGVGCHRFEQDQDDASRKYAARAFTYLSDLKRLHTPRHSADARLLLERPIVCRSLETFCCQVVGGNRLTVDEQVAYDSWTITPMRDGEAATSTTTTATALETAQEEKRSQVEKYQTGQDLHRYIYATFQG